MNSLAKKEPTTDIFTHYRRTGFTLEPCPTKSNCHNLELFGFLAPGWTGRLAAGLADHRISILRGSAEKVNASMWRSCFELKTAPFAPNPQGIDFLALANTEPNHKAAAIELLSFTAEPAADHEGSAFIELKGVDRLGFLGDVLDYLSMRCLFPVRMTIDTLGEAAADRFWLRGVGGSVPSDAITDSVREGFQQFLVDRR